MLSQDEKIKLLKELGIWDSIESRLPNPIDTNIDKEYITDFGISHSYYLKDKDKDVLRVRFTVEFKPGSVYSSPENFNTLLTEVLNALCTIRDHGAPDLPDRVGI